MLTEVLFQGYCSFKKYDGGEKGMPKKIPRGGGLNRNVIALK